MWLTFFFKVFKISCIFQTCNENPENVFGFWYNCVRTSSGKISLLRREYMWSLVNLLKHSPKISDVTKRDPSVLDLSEINGKFASKHRRETFQQCFGLANSFTSKGSSEAGAFGHSTHHILRCQELQNYLRYEGHLFFQSVQKFM